MSEIFQAVPVVISGPDQAGRYACFQQLRSEPGVRVARDCALIDDLLAARLADERSGVVVVAGRLHSQPGDLTAFVRAARQRLPSWPVLVVSQPPALMFPQIAGWLAFGSPINLTAAVRVAATGGWVSDREATFAGRRGISAGASVLTLASAPLDPSHDLGSLTARERQVLALMARGMSNPAIARQLDIATDTVKSHVKHIMGKLNVRDRTTAAVLATRAQIA